ncbi:MAG TPA: acyl carrier protein [Oscillospiraceae bacterium]|nr:acyl carrier protein [Oscillospiraceae bacterium]HPF55581.1 acyl carrier protein [Clostridiales bacterium]HPK35816.1 acyl carrier protein [Oscillospiraceae bacterium]HPR76334.1 acyl carrier protein [Oscillospiraceae bacterium]
MVTEKIKSLLVEKLECDASKITSETVLTDLGIDSLDITELVMDLETEFNVEIELADDIKTVSDLAGAIEVKMKG